MGSSWSKCVVLNENHFLVILMKWLVLICVNSKHAEIKTSGVHVNKILLWVKIYIYLCLAF